MIYATATLRGLDLLAADFWRHIELSAPTGCWLWSGTIDPKGYGFLYHEKRKWRAHRLVYTQMVGQIPDDLVLDHLCRTRSCVNPEHLEPVTQRVNVLRGNGPSARAAAATRCPSGHPYDEANTLVGKAGDRSCRKCKGIQNKARYARAKLKAA